MAIAQTRRDPLRELAELGGNPEELAAQAEPFGARKPGVPRHEGIETIILPPAHLVDELDNSAANPPEPEPEDEAVTLDLFGDDLPTFTRVLKHPFVWAGERVKAIEVHQLTTIELGKVSTELGKKGGKTDLYGVYGYMVRVQGTGTPVPARVLRKMPAVDGYPIVTAAYDFLPPSFLVEAG